MTARNILDASGWAVKGEYFVVMYDSVLAVLLLAACAILWLIASGAFRFVEYNGQ